MKTYSEKLKDPRWQRKRLEIMQRDGFKCRNCDDDKSTLHVHHWEYSGEPWEANDDDMMTYCDKCHEMAHDLSMRDSAGIIKATRRFLLSGPKFVANVYLRHINAVLFVDVKRKGLTPRSLRRIADQLMELADQEEGEMKEP